MGTMPTSGPLLVVFVVGAALFAGGFLVIFGVLAANGGLARSRTFSVIGSLPKRSTLVFLGGLAACGLGGLSTCGAVAAGDARVRSSCVKDCRRAGHSGGRIGPSSAPAARGRRPPPSCWCVRGASSVELRPARPAR